MRYNIYNMKKLLSILIAVAIFIPFFVKAQAIDVDQGGTGRSSVPQGAFLYGNGQSALGATTSPTVGYITATTTTNATSTLQRTSISGSISILGEYFTNFTTYVRSLFTQGTGITISSGSISVNTSQNISTLSNLTSNGFVKTSGGTGALSIDTNTYITGNQSITLSGDVTGSGSTAITTAIGSNKVTVGMLAQAGANTILGNPTGSTANVQAFATSSLFTNASATKDGLLTSTDWNTFNNKQPAGSYLTVSPFTASTNFAVTNQATTGIVWFQNGFNASSTSHVASTTFDISGNVGIGSTTPGAKLAIVAGVTNSNNIIDSNGSINNFLQFNIQNTSTGSSAESGYSATANNGTPTTNFMWMGINNSNFYNPQTYTVGGAGDTNLFGAGNDMFIVNNNATKAMYFLTGGSATTTNTAMTILSNRNVGIGTTSPYLPLSVAGGGVFSGDVRSSTFTATSTASSSIPFLTGGVGSDLTINTNTVNTLKLQPSFGKVTIGNGTPAYALDVFGPITGAVVDNVIRANSGADYVAIAANNTKAGGTGQANFLLQKNGSNKFQFGLDFATNGTLDFFVYDATTQSNGFYIANNGDIRLGSKGVSGTGGYNGTQKLTIIASTGNVGIGNTSPAFPFQVSSTSLSNTMKGQIALTDSGAGSNLKNWLLTSNQGTFYLGTTTDTSATSTIAALTINPNANLGIGSTSPSSRLSVTGNSYVSGLSTASNFIANSATATSTFAGAVAIGTSTPPVTSLFTVGTSTPIINVGRISGKVGFGCENNGATSYTFGCGSNPNVNPNINLLVQGSTDARLGTAVGDKGTFMSVGDASTYGALFAYDYAGGVPLNLILGQFGNKVGVGTTSPFATFAINPTAGYASNQFVVGSSTATNFLIDNSGHIFAPNTTSSGSAQTGYWCYDTSGQMIRDSAVCLVSARKFKKDILPIDMGLNDLLKLTPVSYYKKDPIDLSDSHRQIGFIADDVASVSRELDETLVTRDSKGDVHGFRYEQFTALLTKSIQDLNAKFENTKNGVEENWQWLVMGILVIWNVFLTIKTYKK